MQHSKTRVRSIHQKPEDFDAEVNKMYANLKANETVRTMGWMSEHYGTALGTYITATFIIEKH